MSRTVRAGIALLFGYARFAIAVGIGFWLIPFTLHHVGAVRYGYWLASGELIAYAGLSEFGVLTTLPWLIAEADGRGDRDELRALLSSGAAASCISAVGCLVLAIGLWFFLPAIAHLGDADRHAILGPVLLVAVAGIIKLPLRVVDCTLDGLQDVRNNGMISLSVVLMSTAVTVGLLDAGYGLYALALADGLPPLVSGGWNYMRMRRIAPDLLRDWPRPTWASVRRLFGEGAGTWLAGWGWRLVTATDGLVLATLRNPTGVAALAMTSKLGQTLVQMAWMPCDSGLVGLANLAGEQRTGRRVHEAVVVLMRVYLALAGGVACVVIAANPAFVRRWVGPQLYAGGVANMLIAALVLAMTIGHALAVVPSVLGQRLQIGWATISVGVLHIILAFGLGMRFGLVGILTAGVISHGVVFPALAWRPFAAATATYETELMRDVLLPWSWRFVPMAVAAFFIQRVLGTPPLLVTIAVGGTIAAVTMFAMRRLYLEFGPVRTLYDRIIGWMPLRRPAL